MSNPDDSKIILQDASAVEECEAPQEMDDEQPLIRLRYPRSIPFIVCNEFCERFNYYGMRSILTAYLLKLKFDKDNAAIIYHTSLIAVYLFAPFGAILADSYWGKFRTIFWLSIVYAAGSTITAIGSFEAWGLPAREFTIVGLVLIGIGAGGIKPCVSAFGGEQFKMPEQAGQLAKFFAIFYFTINAGSVLSTVITPLLKNMGCFGMKQCFFGGFGLPAVLMIIAIVIFGSGYSKYINAPPGGNMFVKVFCCIGNAIKMRSRERRVLPRDHWLDYAEPIHGRRLVKDTKILLGVIVIFIPVPLFWALFDQQGSRWITQGKLMNGAVGKTTLTSDQLQALNPLLILILIPLFEFAFYPFLSLLRIRRPLQKMTLGGILAGCAFLCSMYLQFVIDKSKPHSINLLWQIPQYFVMTMAEVMFSVTGLEFAFTQAPESMKSVVQALWLLTVAIGNFIVTLIITGKLFSNPAYEFLLFAGLMFLDMLLFIALAYRYKTVTPADLEHDE